MCILVVGKFPICRQYGKKRPTGSCIEANYVISFFCLCLGSHVQRAVASSGCRQRG